MHPCSRRVSLSSLRNASSTSSSCPACIVTCTAKINIHPPLKCILLDKPSSRELRQRRERAHQGCFSARSRLWRNSRGYKIFDKNRKESRIVHGIAGGLNLTDT